MLSNLRRRLTLTPDIILQALRQEDISFKTRALERLAAAICDWNDLKHGSLCDFLEQIAPSFSLLIRDANVPLQRAALRLLLELAEKRPEEYRLLHRRMLLEDNPSAALRIARQPSAEDLLKEQISQPTVASVCSEETVVSRPASRRVSLPPLDTCRPVSRRDSDYVPAEEVITPRRDQFLKDMVGLDSRPSSPRTSISREKTVFSEDEFSDDDDFDSKTTFSENVWRDDILSMELREHYSDTEKFSMDSFKPLHSRPEKSFVRRWIARIVQKIRA